MKRRTTLFSWPACVALAGAIFAQVACAAEQPMGFVGKNGWLFYRVEFTDVANRPDDDKSIDLIRRLNRVLARNDIALVVVMVPLKARIYGQYLPDDVKINPYMMGNYDRMERALRADHVNVVDLNSAFLNSPKRDSDTPFFFRLDTHWSPAGALLAAQTVKSGIDGDPALRKALDATPEVKYAISDSQRMVNTPSRDLVNQLPAGAPAFPEERVAPFFVSRTQEASGGLLGNAPAPGITLMGSSYSAPWYHFPDALHYTLQRDLLAISVEATHGSWEGMESYLRDDAFQTNRPELLIWELPERDMHMPPDYRYRDERYQSDNTEWLLRVAALVQSRCTPSPVAAQIVSGGLAMGSTEAVTAGKTTEDDFVELHFSKPVGNLDYLVASVATNGPRKIVLEASGAGVETRWFDVPVPGNGAEHMLTTPLPSAGKGFTRLRIYPGNSSAFVFRGMRVCRQAADLLK